ncbi:MAG: sacsin N-terminal ATP-binding-like domain-containing protein, partial [Candidatus Poribacteria bacterium]
MSQSKKEEIFKITKEALKNQPDALADIGRGERYLRQDYQGRYVFELLQNIRDAALYNEDDGRSSAFFLVTRTALIVANYGRPFDLDGIKSIRSIGLSTKASTKYIGHKGIGFKSVFEITENPQIFSGGYQLQFSRGKTVQRLRQYASALPDEQRLSYLRKLDESQKDISIMHIPHWMSVDEIKEERDRDLIQTLQGKNCSTLIRLPFKPGVTSEAVFKHLLIFPKEALLFLASSFSDNQEDAASSYNIKRIFMKNLVTNRSRILTINTEQKTANVRLTTLQSNLQSQSERWLVFATNTEIPDKALTDEQRPLFSERQNAEIQIALSLDDTGDIRLLSQRRRLFYVYFPTQEPAPIPCLIHSFFQLKPARTHFYECALNEWLCKQVVSFLTSDVLEWVKNDERLKTALPFLLIPSYSSSPAAELLRNKLLPVLKETAFVPTVDYRRFVKPSEICLIPDALSAQRVDVPLSSLFSDKSISAYFRRDCYFPAAEIYPRKDIVNLLRTYGAKEFTQEVLLAILDDEAQRRQGEPRWFQQLYYFLRNATYILAQHSKKNAEAFVAKLKRKKILLSMNNQLYSPDGEAQIFLPPLRYKNEIAEVPDALRKQFEFLHPEIKVTETDDKGDELLNGLGNFLVKNGFVKTFQFSDVLEEGILPQMEVFDETFAEAEKWRILRYVKHLFDRQLINASALKQLPMGTIRVPVSSGGISQKESLAKARHPGRPTSVGEEAPKWMAAQDVYFTAAWSGRDHLEQLYQDVGESYFLSSPTAMGVEESDKESWKRFFVTIGVNEIPRIVRFTPPQNVENYQIVQANFAQLNDHPSAKEGKLFAEYLSFLADLGEDESFRPAVCWRIHPKARQTLEQVFALDKFEKLIETEEKRSLLLSLVAENWSFYSRFKTSTYQCSHLGCNKDKHIPSFFLFCLKHAAWIPTTLKTKDGKDLFLPSEKVWVMSDVKEQALTKYLPFAQEIYDKTFLRDLSFKNFNSATVADFLDLLHFLEVAYPKESLIESEKSRFKA